MARWVHTAINHRDKPSPCLPVSLSPLPPTMNTQKPSEFDDDLSALDLLDDGALWEIVHSNLSAGDVTRLVWLLEENTDNGLTGSERAELHARMTEANRLSQRKTYAAQILQHRGHDIPPLEEL